MNLNNDNVLSLNDNLLKLFPGQIYCKDKNGCYLYCNQAFADSIGLSNHVNIVGKNDHDFLPTSLANHVSQTDLQIIKSEKPHVTCEGNHLSIKTPLLNQRNEFFGLLSIFIDIKNVKILLEKNLRTLDNIIAAMPWHIYWKDKNGVLLGCNDQQAIDLGLKSRQDIVGKTEYDIVSKTLDEKESHKIAEAITLADKEIMDSGEPKTIEEFTVRPGGAESHYLSQKKPLYDDDDQVIGLLGISVDITERKLLEEKLRTATQLAEKANSLKTEFIQNMQHDIRTPISGIWSLLDNMAHSNTLQEFQRVIPFAAKASKELLELCNEIIDFENIEYGEKPIYSRKFSLIELMHGVLNLNSAAALTHGTSLILDISTTVPDIITGDDYRLKKILINLVGNAVKFTEHGQITLSIINISQSDRKITLRFTVIDTGIGIPADQIDNIFEKFTRLNPSNTGKFKGTGLGLHIVKKFAAEIGAELDVSSEIGKGATFTLDACFDIPLVAQLAHETSLHVEQPRHFAIGIDSEDPSIETEVTTPIITQSSGMHMHDAIRVILIEDDAIAMLMAETRFKGTTKPCQVFKAESVANALQLLKAQKADLVVSDLGLPDGTGFDIIELVKQDSSHTNYQTPFIALTAHSDDAKKEKAKKVGFLALYNKPLLQQHADKIVADFVIDTPSSNHQEAVDIITSEQIVGGNRETALNLLNMLVTSFIKEQDLFEIAFHNNDFRRARDLFHKFRGGLSYVRAPEVERLAKELHEEVKALEVQKGNLHTLKPKLEQLANSIDDVQLWLNDHTS